MDNMFLIGLLGLLVLFQIKHFLADYPLQIQYMMGKFKASFWEAFLPLLAHCAIHGLFTFAIAVGCSQSVKVALLLALFDMVIHFTMDRIKASPGLLGRFKALSADQMTARLMGFGSAKSIKKDLRSNRLFWWSLGFDQMVHHLTDYAIIFYMVVKS